jgi:hypothetical protein
MESREKGNDKKRRGRKDSGKVDVKDGKDFFYKFNYIVN